MKISKKKLKETIQSLAEKGYLTIDNNKNISLTEKGLEAGLLLKKGCNEL